MNIYVTYACNFNCKFCSLRKEKSNIVDLKWLDNILSSHKELCSNINILGGEPSILPLEYQEEIVNICIKYSGEKPYYITNLSTISPVLSKCKPIISYDFKLREKSNIVLSNIFELQFNFSLSTILTNYLVEEIGAKKYLNLINTLSNCTRADLDLYYRSNNDKYDFTPNNSKLLDFISIVMKNPKVNLAPLSAMRNYIDQSTNNISDYFAIFPDYQYGVRLDYPNGPWKKFNDYNSAIKYFNNKVRNNNMCNSCEFNNTCWYPYSDTVCHGNKEMLNLFKMYINSR